MRNIRKKINLEWVITSSLFVLLVVGMYSLFLRQCKEVIAVADSSSDMLAYLLTIEGIDSGYSYPYPIMFWIAKGFYWIFSVEVSLSITVALLNGLTFLCVKKVMVSYVGVTSRAWIYDMLAILILFYSMLFIPNYAFEGIPFRYVGVFSPNPFHNATILAARPFTIISFFLFVKIYREYKENFSWKRGGVFCIALLIATMTKPSFTIVFCGAMGLVMLYDLIQSKFRLWKESFSLGVMFIPTFIHLAYQYSGVFVGENQKGEETGMGIGYLVAWGEICRNVPLAIFLGNGFPIIVLCFHRKDFVQNTMYRLAWYVYGMGLLMFMFLYEKGFRVFHMNFSWGYMAGMFILLVASVLVLLKETRNRVSNVWALLIQWGIFIVHIMCGIFYFITILRGDSYY